jgi:N-acetylneuraminic acid mutarotase
MKRKNCFFIIYVITGIIFISCELTTEQVPTEVPAKSWTWISGTNVQDQDVVGVYGIKGEPSSSNLPGARYGCISWIDAHDNLWLFAGFGNDGHFQTGLLNDLWKFDGTNWTWVSGSTARDAQGVYGEKGKAEASNVPGARKFSVSWIDKSGNLWLFGGEGCWPWEQPRQYYNDLWKFDGENWTWVSGSDSSNQIGEYGEKGIAAAGNVPGARRSSINWIDAQGNLWLFGGCGLDTGNNTILFNDLWKFDGENWTWVSGSDSSNQIGEYGEQGIAAAANVPGARIGCISWIDLQGNLWLFGGSGYDSKGEDDYLNDLWKFDGTNWTWVSGSDSVNQNGVYGVKEQASQENVPGARSGGVCWIDADDNLWLFGGFGFGSQPDLDNKLNDLWKFDGTNWTWVSGSDSICQRGVYGSKGKPSLSNIPGARSCGVSWIDSEGNFWLFGGVGVYPCGHSSSCNDLWRYKPSD